MLQHCSPALTYRRRTRGAGAHLYPVVAAERRGRALRLCRVVQRVAEQHQLLERRQRRQRLQRLVIGDLVVRKEENAQLTALLKARELRDLVVAQPELLGGCFGGEVGFALSPRNWLRKQRATSRRVLTAQ